MRPLKPRRRSILRSSAIATVALAAGLTAAPALADCPWIVQPSAVIGGDPPDYDIMFGGEPDPSFAYYAFTVTDHELAWELSLGIGVAALDDRSRPLLAIDGDDRVRYRADDASIMPLTLYLVVATAPLPELEIITAGFEPARPIAVGLRRGASDTSGPLPHRSLPGYEIRHAGAEPTATALGIAEASYQLCAYQVRLR